MKNFLKLARPKQRRSFFLITFLRSALAAIDLLALLTLWFLTTAVVNGQFLPITIFNRELLQAAPVSEAAVTLWGLAVLLTFLIKGLLGMAMLRMLTKLAVDFEASTAKRVIEKALNAKYLASPQERMDFVGVVHALESGGHWARGAIFGYSVAISEAFLILGLIIVSIVVAPLVTLVLTAVLGGTALILNSFLSVQIQQKSQMQISNSKRMKSLLASALSLKVQLTFRGSLPDWQREISGSVRSASAGSAGVYFLHSLPRYAMEIAILLSVGAVVAASYLIGDFADNAPNAAIVLAAAFRISAALLPLQGAVSLVSSTNELGKDYLDFITHEIVEQESSSQISKRLEMGVMDFLNSSMKILVIVGESGLGKTTALTGLLLDASNKIRFPETVGFGGQRPVLLPGGLAENLSLNVKPLDKNVPNELVGLVEELRMQETLERLSVLADKDLETLSGGELTRLEILRAHFGNPELIVLDEPTAGLDAQLTAKLASYMIRSPQRYIVVTHDREFVSGLQNYLILDLEKPLP